MGLWLWVDSWLQVMAYVDNSPKEKVRVCFTVTQFIVNVTDAVAHAKVLQQPVNLILLNTLSIQDAVFWFYVRQTTLIFFLNLNHTSYRMLLEPSFYRGLIRLGLQMALILTLQDGLLWPQLWGALKERFYRIVFYTGSYGKYYIMSFLLLFNQILPILNKGTRWTTVVY